MRKYSAIIPGWSAFVSEDHSPRYRNEAMPHRGHTAISPVEERRPPNHHDATEVRPVDHDGVWHVEALPRFGWPERRLRLARDERPHSRHVKYDQPIKTRRQASIRTGHGNLRSPRSCGSSKLREGSTDFRSWHETDMLMQSPHVRCPGMSGPSSDAVRGPLMTRLRLSQQAAPTVTSTDGRHLAIFFPP